MTLWVIVVYLLLSFVMLTMVIITLSTVLICLTSVQSSMNVVLYPDNEEVSLYREIHSFFRVSQYVWKLGTDVKSIMKCIILEDDLDSLRWVYRVSASYLHMDNDYIIRFAAINKRFNMVRWLCRIGLDIGKDYDDVLIFAATNGDLEILYVLYKLGYYKNNFHYYVSGYGAISLAAYNGHLQIVEWFYNLKKYDWCPWVDNEMGDLKTVIMAIENGHLDVAKFILEKYSFIILRFGNVFYNDGYGVLEDELYYKINALTKKVNWNVKNYDMSFRFK